MVSFAGINPERADTVNEGAPCKSLDYADYANYLIVMSGDFVGNVLSFDFNKLHCL